MTDELLRNPHPGDILREEYLEPTGLTAYRLARDTRLPQTRISQILRGRRGITAETALRFGRYFGTSAEFWMNLQRDYELMEARRKFAAEVEQVEPVDWDAVEAANSPAAA